MILSWSFFLLEEYRLNDLFSSWHVKFISFHIRALICRYPRGRVLCTRSKTQAMLDVLCASSHSPTGKARGTLPFGLLENHDTNTSFTSLEHFMPRYTVILWPLQGPLNFREKPFCGYSYAQLEREYDLGNLQLSFQEKHFGRVCYLIWILLYGLT